MKADLAGLLVFLVGLVLFSVGLGLAWLPLGLIGPGLVLMAAAAYDARSKEPQA